jgi:hypothetical protein
MSSTDPQPADTGAVAGESHDAPAAVSALAAEIQSHPTATRAPAPELGLGGIDILIGDDGEVIFTDLPPELLEIALELDPDSDLACRRPTGAARDPNSEDGPR